VDPDSLIELFSSLRFILYSIWSVSLLIVLQATYSRYCRKTVLIDLGLVALYGCWTVLATKAFSSLLNAMWFSAFKLPISYFLLFVMLLTGVMQIRYVCSLFIALYTLHFNSHNARILTEFCGTF
jgi:hypothetical protein